MHQPPKHPQLSSSAAFHLHLRGGRNKTGHSILETACEWQGVGNNHFPSPAGYSPACAPPVDSSLLLQHISHPPPHSLWSFFRYLVIILSIWRNQCYQWASLPAHPPASLPIVLSLYTHLAETCQKSSISKIRAVDFLFSGLFAESALKHSNLSPSVEKTSGLPQHLPF